MTNHFTPQNLRLMGRRFSLALARGHDQVKGEAGRRQNHLQDPAARPAARSARTLAHTEGVTFLGTLEINRRPSTIGGEFIPASAGSARRSRVNCPGPAPAGPGDLPLPHTFNVKLGCTPSVQSLLQLLVISFLMLHHTTCPSV